MKNNENTKVGLKHKFRKNSAWWSSGSSFAASISFDRFAWQIDFRHTKNVERLGSQPRECLRHTPWNPGIWSCLALSCAPFLLDFLSPWDIGKTTRRNDNLSGIFWAKAVAKNNMSKRSFISLASSGRSVKILGQLKMPYDMTSRRNYTIFLRQQKPMFKRKSTSKPLQLKMEFLESHFNKVCCKFTIFTSFPLRSTPHAMS